MLLRISDIVMLESNSIFAFMWVTPEKVKNLLVVFRMVGAKLDFEWSLDLFDAIDVLNSWSDTTMAAEDS